MAATRTVAEKAKDCQTAWFAMLERARLTGDRESEARARRELARLGVSVNFFDSASGDDTDE